MAQSSFMMKLVHGGIRHLENKKALFVVDKRVHGGIRHLESVDLIRQQLGPIHGGIRHLEKRKTSA